MKPNTPLFIDQILVFYALVFLNFFDFKRFKMVSWCGAYEDQSECTTLLNMVGMAWFGSLTSEPSNHKTSHVTNGLVGADDQ